MSDPFSIMRRKPAAATYGRRALAARRVGSQPGLADKNNSSGGQVEPDCAASRPNTPVVPMSLPTIGDAPSSDSSLSDGSSDEAPNKLATWSRAEPTTEGMGSSGLRARRTVNSAMSKLDELYESTRPKDIVQSDLSARAILDSAKAAWDLGEVSQAQTEKAARLSAGKPPRKTAGSSVKARGVGSRSRRAVNRVDDAQPTSTIANKAKKDEGTQPASLASTLGDKVPMALGNPRRQSRAGIAGNVAAMSKPSQSKRARSTTCKPEAGFSGDATDNDGAGDKSSSASVTCLKTQAPGFPSKIVKAMRGTCAVPVQRPRRRQQRDQTSLANSSISLDNDSWDMDALLASSPLLGRNKTARRIAAIARRKGAQGSSDIASSSPPSTPGRLLDAGKSSRAPSSLGDSDGGEAECGIGVFTTNTPKRQAGKHHARYTTQGPSVATSKRLQARAYSQNVVFTYGRTRDDDVDCLEEFGRALGMPGILCASSQPLLEHAGIEQDSDSVAAASYSGSETSAGRRLPAKRLGAPTASKHLLEPTGALGGSGCRGEPLEPFKKQLGLAIHGLNEPTAGNAAAACYQLLESLCHEEFCDELLGSKTWLPTLLQSMHRAREDPAVLSTAMLVIAMAFHVPSTMQQLVFERQVLETVAEILRSTLDSEMLLLRQRRDFVSIEHYRCAALICWLARERSVVSSLLPLSTYNLALAALHSFTRSDDAAYLAMARLLRSEIRESGCLGLAIERIFAWSIPHFVDTLEGPSAFTSGSLKRSLFGSLRDGAASPLAFGNAAANNSHATNSGVVKGDGDDMWMEFDLPEETRQVPRTQSAAGHKIERPTSKAALQTNAAGTSLGGLGKLGSAQRLLQRESDGGRPTYASVALELEILRFCTTESEDNQSEVLANDLSIPLLLSLLAMCQQSSVRQSGAGLVRALEIAALTLQLLVNLSNNSTTFCARFVECKGLDIVSKSIAFISQRLEVPGSAAEHGTAEFSPRRKALANDVSDLRYDILLITSALLTNVVDSDPSSTLYFSHVLQSPQCKLVVQCFPECVCSGRLPLSVLLTRSFLACHSAGGAADAAVAAGYLSVLLGVLVREKTDGRKSILQLLPGQSTALLIAHIESFIQVSDEVNRRFAGLLGGLAHLPQSNSQVAASRHLNPRMLQIHGADEGCNANALAIPRASASCSVAPSKISASLRTVIESLSGLQ